MSPLAPLLQALETTGVDVAGWGLAWARVAPAIALVPAFGLRAVPAPVRVGLGLSMAVGIAPALRPIAVQAHPWGVQLVIEAARGLPVALAAAVSLWAATMAGGLVDDLRGGREQLAMPVVQGPTSPTGVLLAMLVAVAFLSSGGPARIAIALSDPGLELAGPITRAAFDLAGGIQLAIAVAAPVLAASVVVEVAGALVSRAAMPAYVQPLFAPLRSVLILAVAALVFERMAALLVVGARAAP